MAQYFFTAISIKYDPLYLIIDSDTLIYINLSKNSLISRTIKLKDIYNI